MIQSKVTRYDEGKGTMRVVYYGVRVIGLLTSSDRTTSSSNLQVVNLNHLLNGETPNLALPVAS